MSVTTKHYAKDIKRACLQSLAVEVPFLLKVRLRYRSSCDVTSENYINGFNYYINGLQE